MKDGLFKNKYRSGTVRLQGFDYGANGAYFITICSHNRQCNFSRIVKGEVVLTRLGKIISEEWEKTGEVRNYATAVEGMVMPNHLHGIIFIHKGGDEPQHLPMHGSYLHFPPAYQNRFGPQRKNLASVIRGFKSAVTSRTKSAGLAIPVWQPNYYEHIIRNEIECDRIVRYIRNNPAQWNKDRELPDNFGWDEAA